MASHTFNPLLAFVLLCACGDDCWTNARARIGVR